MVKIIGLHGIITSGKRGFERGLLHELEYKHGWLTYHPHYRILPLLGYFSFFRKMYVKRVLRNFVDGDHILAHSAGCSITYWVLEELQKTGRRAGTIWFLNAALDRKIVFPSGTYEHIYNLHEDDDHVLTLSKILPFHIFGGMGKDGYKGNSANVTNVTNIVPKYTETFLRHTDFFKSPAKEQLCKLITDSISKK